MARGHVWALGMACAVPVLLAGQAPVGGPLPPGAWTPRIDYACDGVGRVPVWYEGAQAILFLDGRLERLSSERPGSDARYTGDRREWSRKGIEATLAAPGQSQQTRQRCRMVPLATWRPLLTSRRYICTDGLSVEVAPTLEAATVTFRGETYRMREVPLATGTLYTDGVRTWRGPAQSRMFAEADGDAVFARGCQPGTFEDTASLGGTIAYRTRQALPAGAVVDVRLVDATRADAPSTPLARRVLVTAGEQVPLTFTLTYAPAVIEPGHRYLVEATIAFGGRVRFRTTTMHPVLEDGTPTDALQVMVQPVR